MTLLRATGIWKFFGGVQALKGVSFELRPGEVHALVGENGAGKSTLIKIITGAMRPDAGALELAGRPVVHSDPRTARRLGISAIYQQPALFPELTVAENIALGVEPGGAWRLVRWGERQAKARELLSRVGALVHAGAEVRMLTMPEQQLVEIARALGASARVLIMDEPTSSLSEREVEKLHEVVRSLRRDGVGVIYISHRLDELFHIADRVTVLRDGAWVATELVQNIDRATLIRLMVGRELTTVFPKQSVSIGDPIVELRNLGCRAAGVRSINLALRAGEIVGLAGLVGAGRTELARIVFGLTPADEGQIVLRNKNVTINSPRRAIDLGIAYVPEDRRRHGVMLDFPVVANTSLAVLNRLSFGGRLSNRREKALARSMVERLAVKTPSIDALTGQLSGGNQQKVSVARWLATEPKLLILDEPTQGIDIGAKAEIHRLMGALAARGMAILLISSELPEILGMSDRIAVMYGGRIVAELNRDEATQERVLSLALGHKAA